MTHAQEREYYERDHRQYLRDHRHDIVSLAEEVSAAQGLGKEAAVKSVRVWCAMCGKMTDHGSGACPQLHSQNESSSATPPSKP